jgi:sugar/nucleoside kinase (ribokinase family)
VRIGTFGDVLLTRAGDQAANVAAWAASLGADAVCIAKRRDDPSGETVARELAAHGVAFLGPVGDGPFSPEELDPAWLVCDVLHVSGYVLAREPISAPALLAARLAREAGARVSVDVAAWTEIRSFGPVRFRELLDELAPDVLFATEAEWELLGGAYLSAPTGVLKRGARGCSVFTGDAKLDFAALEVDVVDPTGAGDALAAGFLLGGSLEEAARRGIEAAARCSAKVGSLP